MYILNLQDFSPVRSIPVYSEDHILDPYCSSFHFNVLNST